MGLSKHVMLKLILCLCRHVEAYTPVWNNPLNTVHSLGLQGVFFFQCSRFNMKFGGETIWSVARRLSDELKFNLGAGWIEPNIDTNVSTGIGSILAWCDRYLRFSSSSLFSSCQKVDYSMKTQLLSLLPPLPPPLLFCAVVVLSRDFAAVERHVFF